MNYKNHMYKKFPKLKKTEIKCSNCGHLIEPDQPYINKDFVGLISQSCPKCGNTKDSCMTVTSRESK